LSADQSRRYQQWREGGGRIQDLLEDLSDEQREMLLSGLTDDNFKRAWPDE
jgi:hypothetical protein